jgi:hypothetical protein
MAIPARLVFDQHNRLVGVIIGRDDDASYALHINDVIPFFSILKSLSHETYSLLFTLAISDAVTQPNLHHQGARAGSGSINSVT